MHLILCDGRSKFTTMTNVPNKPTIFEKGACRGSLISECIVQHNKSVKAK